MIYDRYPELQSKWDKAFWTRGYYVSTIGNITEEAIKKYIREQAEESRKENSEVPIYKRTSNNACDTALLGEHVIDPYEVQSKPPLEVVVMTRNIYF